MRARVAGVLLAGFTGLAALPACVWAAPQQQSQQDQSKQSQSVAETARKAKEQQKNAPKSPAVWTNDTVGNVQGTVNVVGQPTAPPSAAPAAESTAGTAANATASTAPAVTPAESSEKLAKLAAELTDAQKTLTSAETDLDIAQRKHDLDAAQYYGTPNYSANQKGQTMLDGEKSTIASKKAGVEAAQKKVADLESQIKALGGKIETVPAKPASPQS